MANINIEVVSVGQVETVPTKNGKSYQTVEVAYKKDGKIEGKKIMSFVNPSVFKEVQKLKNGDKANVEIEKDDKGYWQWRSISIGGETPAQLDAAQPTAAKSVSNYETREERQQRQQFIIRQSSISSAIELIKKEEWNGTSSVEEVLSIAEQFVHYVNNGLPKTAMQELEDMQDDIPY